MSEIHPRHACFDSFALSALIEKWFYATRWMGEIIFDIVQSWI